MTMTTNNNDLFCRAGQALYGRRWQSDLARDLDLSDRTIRRYVAGTETPRPGVYVDLLRLVTERTQDLDDLAEDLRRAGQ